MVMGWSLDDRAILISMEKTDEVYGRLMREFSQLRSRHAAAQAELKRVGNLFLTLGRQLTENAPALASMDWQRFEKEILGLRKLVDEQQDLLHKVRDKRNELEQFGPLPKFD